MLGRPCSVGDEFGGEGRRAEDGSWHDDDIRLFSSLPLYILLHKGFWASIEEKPPPGMTLRLFEAIHHVVRLKAFPLSALAGKRGGEGWGLE